MSNHRLNGRLRPYEFIALSLACCAVALCQCRQGGFFGGDGGQGTRDGLGVEEGGLDGGDREVDADGSGRDADWSVPGSLEWVRIPGGSFMMGSASSPYDAERPAHLVTVPAFEMLRTEVTVAQYSECVRAGNCRPPDTGGDCNWNDSGYGTHPVNCVDWYQMAAFCAWAQGRLPSEAEWEYAARSGAEGRTYPWGEAEATCDDAVMKDTTTDRDGCDLDRTWAVCSKPSGNTARGLCDMAGNVWEWVQDWHHSSYIGAPDDGSAWEHPVGTYRGRRGGSYVSVANDLRVAGRAFDLPSYSAAKVGARCARAAP